MGQEGRVGKAPLKSAQCEPAVRGMGDGYLVPAVPCKLEPRASGSESSGTS